MKTRVVFSNLTEYGWDNNNQNAYGFRWSILVDGVNRSSDAYITSNPAQPQSFVVDLDGVAAGSQVDAVVVCWLQSQHPTTTNPQIALYGEEGSYWVNGNEHLAAVNDGVVYASGELHFGRVTGTV